jgi:hypothetical protein
MDHHYRTPDNSQSVCTEHAEFDVILSGETVATGSQPTDYCGACGAVEPEWTLVSDDEFDTLFPR